MYTWKWRRNIFISSSPKCQRKKGTKSFHTWRDSTDRQTRGEMSRWWTGGIKATAHLHGGQSRLHREGSRVGSLPRLPAEVRECDQQEASSVGLGIKGQTVEMPLCKWGFAALPGSSLEALEDQPGNRKLTRSVFERLLGW